MYMGFYKKNTKVILQLEKHCSLSSLVKLLPFVKIPKIVVEIKPTTKNLQRIIHQNIM
jgi:hypothetical protein